MAGISGYGSFEVIEQIVWELSLRFIAFCTLSFDIVKSTPERHKSMRSYVDYVAKQTVTHQARAIMLPDCITKDQFNLFPDAFRVFVTGKHQAFRFYYHSANREVEQMAEQGLFDMVVNVDKVGPNVAAKEIVMKALEKAECAQS